MSYNTWATRNNVKYRALICERIPSGAHVVDLCEAYDGGPIADDGLLLHLPDRYITGQQIVLWRQDDAFFFEDKDVPTQGRDHAPQG